MPIREMHVLYGKCIPVEGKTDPVSIKNGRDVAALMAPLLEPEVVEVCYVLLLTTPLTLIGYHQVSRGSLNQAPMYPREVYKAAILANAASIVLVHNHPSGDPTPSRDDLDLTRRLKDAGELLGIGVLDHIIIGHDGWFISLKEQGQL